VSESSLGSTWSLNSGENRLTPWRNDPVFDAPSEALYLRDEETAAVWSPTPLPAGRSAETRRPPRRRATRPTRAREPRARSGADRLRSPRRARSRSRGSADKHAQPRHRRLTATYYAEWVLGSRREDTAALSSPSSTRRTRVSWRPASWNAEFAGRVAFLASREEVHGFTSDRTEFLGRRGDYARPRGAGALGPVRERRPWRRSLRRAAGALELAPGEELETHFILGQGARSRGGAPARRALPRRRGVEAAWKAAPRVLGRHARKHAGEDAEPGDGPHAQPMASLPDALVADLRAYGLLPVERRLRVSRPAPGRLALLHAAPERHAPHILESARHQFEEGDVLHWWHPPSGRGVRTRCSDDMAWLPYVTAEYVAATGDTGSSRSRFRS
jgi:cyclic beta-1,2-glucan synthetase